jgi:glucosamine-phosphate N-acetyltransferase
MSDVTIRELEYIDLSNGFIETLCRLSPTTTKNIVQSMDIINKLRQTETTTVLVAQKLDREIIGTATLVLMPKFIHNGGVVGQIEDVVVKDAWSRQGIGSALVRRCISLAKEKKCYKVVLHCKEEIQYFYTSLGFRPHEVALRLDLGGENEFSTGEEVREGR